MKKKFCLDTPSANKDVQWLRCRKTRNLLVLKFDRSIGISVFMRTKYTTRHRLGMNVRMLRNNSLRETKERRANLCVCVCFSFYFFLSRFDSHLIIRRSLGTSRFCFRKNCFSVDSKVLETSSSVSVSMYSASRPDIQPATATDQE